jgi:predicted Zn-dependent peptidase
MKDYEIYTFPNGVRIVHKQVSHTKIAHCGFILNVGSRDELEQEQGLAHFWEHMAFKGTKHRKTYHILSSLESLGGDLNAYTTKEKVCFYASLLVNDFAKAVEILTDITFYSTFPEKELEKERGVILEEMAMYYDSPDDAIHDDFDEVVFGTHPLGRNILGTEESVKSFQVKDFQQFIADNVCAERLIFASVSSLTLAQVVRIASRFLADVQLPNGNRKRVAFEPIEAKKITQKRPITQAHCVMGTTAYSLFDTKRLPLIMLTNLLGGPGMSSRLNLSLREKYGFVYSADAHYAPYTDTGLLSIYFATEQKQMNRCIDIVQRELKLLKEKKLGTSQLHRAKHQLMGQLAMAEESNLSLMLVIGKSILDYGYVESLPHIFSIIEKTTAEEIQKIANELFADTQMSSLIYLPEEQ